MLDEPPATNHAGSNTWAHMISTSATPTSTTDTEHDWIMTNHRTLLYPPWVQQVGRWASMRYAGYPGAPSRVTLIS